MTEEIILLNSIGMYFELIIIILAIILLILILQKYISKRHNLTKLLFIIFILYFLAITFSWISKILVVIQFDYLSIDPFSRWFLYRLSDFRLSEFLVTIAIGLSYILKVRLFQEDYNTWQKWIVIVYGGFTAVYSFMIYERNNTLLDIFAFLAVFVYMMMIYLPFLLRAIQFYREVDEREFKMGFLGLAVMSVGFILIFLGFAIDRVLILLGSPGFTFFYFMGWSSGIIGIFGAYIGYIRPKSS
ncbi:MAG: hypothetical protein GF317_12370 [Candidatus Lokiarchaeota archaeon]|nr:hypothetical protein [Candidatus Lokiarchaeota archaeon]MBD3200443.1 hypothetical protein [Candidatus Lokiarchaeota archaeon]